MNLSKIIQAYTEAMQEVMSEENVIIYGNFEEVLIIPSSDLNLETDEQIQSAIPRWKESIRQEIRNNLTEMPKEKLVQDIRRKKHKPNFKVYWGSKESTD